MKVSAIYEGIMADDRLPSPSAVALEVLRLTRAPETNGVELAHLIATDPAICARVIRAVNAPSIGVRRQVASIDQAVTILGFQTVARIAVAFSVLEENRSGLAEFDYDRFWSESLARAVAARVLASRSKKVSPDEAFTCGLLSSIGRLALVSVYPQMYRDVLVTLGECDTAELGEAERAVFEVDAEVLSAFMMRQWGMPAYEEALSGERDGTPVSKRAREMLQTCRLGGLVARLLVNADVDREQLALVTQGMAGVGIDADLMSSVFGDIIESYLEAGANLQIRTRETPSLAEIYAHAVDRA